MAVRRAVQYGDGTGPGPKRERRSQSGGPPQNPFVRCEAADCSHAGGSSARVMEDLLTAKRRRGMERFLGGGLLFGRRLQQDIDVPIGLVEDCSGGTPAEAWTSAETLRSLGISDTGSGPNTPAVLYNGMIAPVAPLAISGADLVSGRIQHRTCRPISQAVARDDCRLAESFRPR